MTEHSLASTAKRQWSNDFKILISVFPIWNLIPQLPIKSEDRKEYIRTHEFSKRLPPVYLFFWKKEVYFFSLKEKTIKCRNLTQEQGDP